MLHELQLDIFEYLFQSAPYLIGKLQLSQYEMLKLLEKAFFSSNFIVVNSPFDVTVCLLSHVVSKAHVVFLEIGKRHGSVEFILFFHFFWIR